MAFPWDDGIIVRSTIQGDDGTGTYRPVKVDANGALLTSTVVTVPPVTAITSAVATAAPPLYAEGSTQPLSMDLNGGIRVTGNFTVGAAKSSASSVTQVNASATSVTLAALNTNRLGLTIFNKSSSNCYVKLGATASTSSFTVIIFPQGAYEVPEKWVGRVDAIWDSATGFAMVTEMV